MNFRQTRRGNLVAWIDGVEGGKCATIFRKKRVKNAFGVCVDGIFLRESFSDRSEAAQAAIEFYQRLQTAGYLAK